MQLPPIRKESTGFNIAEIYFGVNSKCDCPSDVRKSHVCGADGVLFAFFPILDNVTGAMLLCQKHADEFAQDENAAGRDYLLVPARKVYAIAERQHFNKTAQTKKYRGAFSPERQRILEWIAAQPAPARPSELSEAFGGSYHVFCTMMRRWAMRGWVEKVTLPPLGKGRSPGVGYRVAR